MQDYRVVAVKAGENKIVSVSNTVQSAKKLHVHVPNAFSPDGDGINDTFTAISHGVEEYSIDIFNRWGEVVFHSEDLSESWDGTFKGTESMQDAYVYVIKARGITDADFTTYKGTVSLVR